MVVARRVVMKGHDFSGMGFMERGLAPIEEIRSQIDAPGDEVVGKGNTLRIVLYGLGRQENIIVDHEGAVVRLHGEIVEVVVMAEIT